MKSVKQKSHRMSDQADDYPALQVGLTPWCRRPPFLGKPYQSRCLKVSSMRTEISCGRKEDKLA